MSDDPRDQPMFDPPQLDPHLRAGGVTARSAYQRIKLRALGAMYLSYMAGLIVGHVTSWTGVAASAVACPLMFLLLRSR